MNPYEILGISPHSNPEEIKSAYRRAAAVNHPDKNFGNKKSVEEFQKIQQAYEKIRDHSKPWEKNLVVSVEKSKTSHPFDNPEFLSLFRQSSLKFQNFLKEDDLEKKFIKNLDIKCTIFLNIDQAKKGGDFKVSINLREVLLKLPSDLTDDQKLYFQGYGKHYQNKSGDLIVTVKITSHSNINKSEFVKKWFNWN